MGTKEGMEKSCEDKGGKERERCCEDKGRKGSRADIGKLGQGREWEQGRLGQWAQGRQGQWSQGCECIEWQLISCRLKRNKQKHHRGVKRLR